MLLQRTVLRLHLTNHCHQLSVHIIRGATTHEQAVKNVLVQDEVFLQILDLALEFLNQHLVRIRLLLLTAVCQNMIELIARSMLLHSVVSIDKGGVIVRVGDDHGGRLLLLLLIVVLGTIVTLVPRSMRWQGRLLLLLTLSVVIVVCVAVHGDPSEAIVNVETTSA